MEVGEAQAGTTGSEVNEGIGCGLVGPSGRYRADEVGVRIAKEDAELAPGEANRQKDELRVG